MYIMQRNGIFLFLFEIMIRWVSVVLLQDIGTIASILIIFHQSNNFSPIIKQNMVKKRKLRSKKEVERMLKNEMSVELPKK